MTPPKPHNELGTWYDRVEVFVPNQHMDHVTALDDVFDVAMQGSSLPFNERVNLRTAHQGAMRELLEQLETLQRARDEAIEDALRLGAFSGKDEAVAEVERLRNALGELLRYVPEQGATIHAGYGQARRNAVSAYESSGGT